MKNLRGQRILIAEDNFISGLALADHLRTAEATVLGPFPTLEEAECHALGADLAVLDVDLRGQRVFRLADTLVRANIPFVFLSGFDLADIPGRFASFARLNKPCLETEVEAAAEAALEDSDVTLDVLVPRLRLSARLMIPDAMAADRLVEATLQLALRETIAPTEVGSIATWLHRLMGQALNDRSTQLLN
jgi:hypothetical protein